MMKWHVAFGAAAASLLILAALPAASAQENQASKAPHVFDAAEAMLSEYEFSVEPGYFEYREYPPASAAIAKVPARVLAEVQMTAANRDPQFSSSMGFWVYDATREKALRVILSDNEGTGKLLGSAMLFADGRTVSLASFKVDINARTSLQIEITRPNADEICFLIAGRTRTFKPGFAPVSLSFQAVGADGLVKFIDPP